MRWELADEQDMLRDSFRAWLDHHAPTHAVRDWLDSGEVGPFEQAFARDGWLSVGFPESYGGQGGGLLELALIAEQLGATAAPASAWLASVLALPALVGVPDVASAVLFGDGHAALAVDADRPLDDPGSIEAQADGAGHRVTGSVSSVLGADRARHLLVPARTGSGRQLYLVDAGADGVAVRGRRLLDRSRSVADVTFADVPGVPLEVDVEQVLADAALRAAVLVAADSLGAMERMLELAVEYSRQRKQFGVPIGSFQAVKHAAATMLVHTEAARSIVYYAAASVEQGHQDAALHAATDKAQVTAAGEESADAALTMHGAIGYTWEHDLQLFYKRARLDTRLAGTPSVWNERIAAALPLVPVG